MNANIYFEIPIDVIFNEKKIVAITSKKELILEVIIIIFHKQIIIK